MKIILAGCGKVGKTLTRELSSEGYEVTLIDSDYGLLTSCMERFDVMAVQGNCATMKTLSDAGVEGADLLIACTGNDETNLLCCMTAHTINPRIHTIARLRNPEYTEQAFKMRDAFGLSMIFNPEQQAAAEMERLLLYPGFLKRDTFAKGRVEIVELRIEKDSKLCGAKLCQWNGIVRCRVLVCAVLRDGVAVAPDGNFTLLEGDRIFVTAPGDQLAALLKNLGIVTHKVRNVTVIGGGTLSYYLAKALKGDQMDVRIIEKDRARCVELAGLLPHAKIICGDGGNQQLLDANGVRDSDALITLTGIDESNIIISLYGSSCGIPQVITKIARMDNARITDKLPIGSVISPRKLCCNNIVRYVRAMQNQSGAAITIHSIADGQAEAIEFAVDANTLHCGEPLKNLKLKKNILLVSISRGAETQIPNGDSHFEQGDSVVIVASGETTVLQLNDIFA